MAETSLEPGWLAREMEELPAELALAFSPAALVQSGKSVTLPLPKADADRLYALLDRRFQAWTGKPLKAYRP